MMLGAAASTIVMDRWPSPPFSSRIRSPSTMTISGGRFPCWRTIVNPSRAPPFAPPCAKHPAQSAARTTARGVVTAPLRLRRRQGAEVALGGTAGLRARAHGQLLLRVARGNGESVGPDRAVLDALDLLFLAARAAGFDGDAGDRDAGVLVE